MIPSPSALIPETHAHEFSKTHSKGERKLNDQWFPLVGDFGGREPMRQREALFSFSPEYYSKGKISIFPFSGSDHIVYNKKKLVSLRAQWKIFGNQS
jgi:hypothetical protein